MKISAMAIVDETKQAWADDDDFQIIKPNINIKVIYFNYVNSRRVTNELPIGWFRIDESFYK